VGIGTLNIVAPILVLERLHLSETIVGFVFAVQGLAGMVSAAIVGRSDSREREKLMLAVPMAGTGMVMALLLVHVNMIVLVLVMGIIGLLNGPLDVALFTVRQRRTHPSWTGRAFAVSMAFNYAGVPIGSALAGAVAAHSIRTAIGFGAIACLLSAIAALAMIPSSE
jgi:predicted MFS family arabinose efflux permease